jgi:hypothetical protein
MKCSSRSRRVRAKSSPTQPRSDGTFRALLRAKADDIHAKRIVFDGIDVLLGLLEDPVAERREIYRIRDWLSQTAFPRSPIPGSMSPTSCKMASATAL